MSAPFKVGEVVEGCNMVIHQHRNGAQCEILELPALRTLEFPSGVRDETTYIVRWADGDVVGVMPRNLRRRKPPASDSGERLIATLIRETLDKAPQRVGETV
jgi:hypothetical protein